MVISTSPVKACLSVYPSQQRRCGQQLCCDLRAPPLPAGTGDLDVQGLNSALSTRYSVLQDRGVAPPPGALLFVQANKK